MAGVILPVIPKTTFDFGGLASSAITATIPLGDPIDVTHYPSIGIAVRLHAAAIDAGNTVTVNIYEDGFLDGSAAAFPGDYVFGITMNSLTPVPCVQFSYVPLLGQFATIGIKGNRGVGTSGQSVTISVDAYLRNGDETPVVMRNGRAIIVRPPYFVGIPPSYGWSGSFPGKQFGNAAAAAAPAPNTGGGGGGAVFTNRPNVYIGLWDGLGYQGWTNPTFRPLSPPPPPATGLLGILQKEKQSGAQTNPFGTSSQESNAMGAAANPFKKTP